MAKNVLKIHHFECSRKFRLGAAGRWNIFLASRKVSLPILFTFRWCWCCSLKTILNPASLGSREDNTLVLFHSFYLHTSHLLLCLGYIFNIHIHIYIYIYINRHTYKTSNSLFHYFYFFICLHKVHTTTNSPFDL